MVPPRYERKMSRSPFQPEKKKIVRQTPKKEPKQDDEEYTRKENRFPCRFCEKSYSMIGNTRFHEKKMHYEEFVEVEKTPIQGAPGRPKKIDFV